MMICFDKSIAVHRKIYYGDKNVRVNNVLQLLAMYIG